MILLLGTKLISRKIEITVSRYILPVPTYTSEMKINFTKKTVYLLEQVNCPPGQSPVISASKLSSGKSS